MDNSYWNETGKYQAQYSEAWEKLIPVSGEAEDGWPEALRAISRIGYDYYNNGFCNLWREEEEYDGDDYYYKHVMDPYYRDMVDYLSYQIPRAMHGELKDFLVDAAGYGNWSNQAGVIDRIIDHIMEQIISSNLLEASNVKTQ